MPRPLSWLHRIVPIARAVAGSARSHYARRDLELLFELQPRSAQQLMAALPNLSIGRARLVEREALSRFLQHLNDAEDPAAAFARLRAEGGNAVRRKLRGLSFEDVAADLDAPPAALTLARGEATVRFQTLEELAEALLYLAAALQGELNAFAERYEPAPKQNDEEGQETERLRAEATYYRDWTPEKEAKS